MRNFIIIFFFFLNLYIVNSNIVINEVMPIPLVGEPEWIELYNFSNENIDIHGYKINDATGIKKIPYFTLNSNTYAVLTKDTNLLKSFRNIPNDALLIETAIPSLNNTSDYLVLKNNNDIIIDSIFYNMKWGSKYFSLERIDAEIPAINQENWSISQNPAGASPGFQNSNIKYLFDISCNKLFISNDFHNISTQINDIGKNKITNFDFSLYIDFNNDEEINENEKIIDFNNILFDNFDTIISFPINSFIEKIEKNGIYSFIAIAKSLKDENPNNDTIFAEIYIRKEVPIVKINEFMYDVTSDKTEFIEIWNGGQDTLIMDNFVIWDAAGSLEKENIKINSSEFKIPPNDFGVVCWDSLFYNEYPEFINNPRVYCYRTNFNLNLSSDLIVLADINGKIYDSLTYFNNWHTKSIIETKNRSLEKINEHLISYDKNSWATCSNIQGATPLSKNSVNIPPSAEIELDISPNPFAPNSKSNDAITKINIKLPFAMSFLNASVFDLSGYKVAELANNRYTGGIAYLEWDGKNSKKYNLQIGQYVLFIEATDYDTGAVASKKAIIVIAD